MYNLNAVAFRGFLRLCCRFFWTDQPTSIVLSSNFFLFHLIASHAFSDGSNPLTRLANLNFAAIGENVAGGQTTAAWAMGALEKRASSDRLNFHLTFLLVWLHFSHFVSLKDSFMGSEGHRRTLLDPQFDCMGSAKVGNKFAQEFGRSSAFTGGCPIPDCAKFGERRMRRELGQRANAWETEVSDSFSASTTSTSASERSATSPEISKDAEDDTASSITVGNPAAEV